MGGIDGASYCMVSFLCLAALDLGSGFFDRASLPNLVYVMQHRVRCLGLGGNVIRTGHKKCTLSMN
jgi:hypothetical protein